MSYWRNAGLSYINYSSTAASMVRQCLKPNLREEAVKRGEESIIKVQRWHKGKPAEALKVAQKTT